RFFDYDRLFLFNDWGFYRLRRLLDHFDFLFRRRRRYRRGSLLLGLEKSHELGLVDDAQAHNHAQHAHEHEELERAEDPPALLARAPVRALAVAVTDDRLAFFFDDRLTSVRCH